MVTGGTSTFILGKLGISPKVPQAFWALSRKKEFKSWVLRTFKGKGDSYFGLSSSKQGKR